MSTLAELIPPREGGFKTTVSSKEYAGGSLADLVPAAQGGMVSPNAAPHPMQFPTTNEDSLAYFIPEPTQEKEVPDAVDETNFLTRALKRGAVNTGVLIADALGADETANDWNEYAGSFEKEYPTFSEDVHGVGDFIGYASELAAENASTMAGMGIAAIGASYALPATLLGVGSATIGATGFNFLTQLGEAERTIKDEGGEGSLQQGLIPALVNTSMDMFSFLGILKRTGLTKAGVDIVEDAAKASRMDKVLKNLRDGNIAMLTEGTTETLQSFNNLLAAKIFTDQRLDVMEPEIRNQLFESFVAGVTMGGTAHTLGSTASGVKRLIAAENANETAIEDNSPSMPEEDTPIEQTQEDTVPPPVLEETPPPTEVTVEPATDDSIDSLVDEVISNAAKPDDVVLAPPVDTIPGPISEHNPEDGDIAKPEEGNALELEQLEAKKVELENLIKDNITWIESQAREGEYNPRPITGPEVGGITLDLPTYEQRSIGELGLGLAPEKHVKGSYTSLKGKSQSLATILSKNATDTKVEGAGVHYTKAFLKGVPKNKQRQLNMVLQELQKQYLGNVPMIVGNPQELFNRVPSGVLGVTNTFKVGNQPYHALGLDLNAINEEQVGPKNHDAAFVETVAHEVGHMVSKRMLQRLPKKARKALYQEYGRWVKRSHNGTLGDWARSRLPALAYAHVMKVLGHRKDEKFRNVMPSQFDYHMSFEEWFADSMAKHVAQDKVFTENLPPELKTFWDEVIDVISNVIQMVKSVFAHTKYKVKNAPVNTKVLETMRPLVQWDAIQEQITMMENPQFKAKFAPEMQAKMEAHAKKHDGIPMTNIEYGSSLFNLEEAMLAAKQEERLSNGFRRNFWKMIQTPEKVVQRWGTSAAKRYMEYAVRLADAKRAGIQTAGIVGEAYRKLNKSEKQAFDSFIFEVSEQSDDVARALLPDELAALYKKHNMTPKAIEVFKSMEGSFAEVRDRLFTAVFKDIVSPVTKSADALAASLVQSAQKGELKALVLERIEELLVDHPHIVKALKKAYSDYDVMRNRNYFPRQRFGKFLLTVRELRFVDVKDEDGEVIGKEQKLVPTYFEAFDYEHERDAFHAELMVTNKADIDSGKTRINKDVQSDDAVRSMYGQSGSVLEVVKKNMEAAGDPLTKEQREILDKLTLEYAPSKRFLNSLKRRKNTAGYSTDVMRTYSTYMQNATSHFARIENTPQMIESLGELKAGTKVHGDTTDLTEMHAYLNDHMKYLLDPGLDYARAKSFIFAWYLGFNPKSAVVNLTQLPLATMPFLIARHGLTKSVKYMSLAMKDAAAYKRGKNSLKEGEEVMMEQLYKEGHLDDGMYNSMLNSTAKTLAPEFAHKLSPKASDAVTQSLDWINNNAGVFFSITEGFNRRINAIVGYRIAIDRGASHQEAVKEAISLAVDTQFEYGKVNRAEMMRGGAGVLLVFQNYMVNMMGLMADLPLYGAKKVGLYKGNVTMLDAKRSALILVSQLLLGGLLGAPGMDYIISIYDWLLRKAGVTEHDLRFTLREWVHDMGINNPDYLLNGIMSNVGGMDFSASLTMGAPVPGIAPEDWGDSAKMYEHAFGAGGSILSNMIKYMGSDDPDTWRNQERIMPVALKNLSKAARWYARGGETDTKGASILPLRFEDNPWDYVTVAQQSLGMAPRKLTKAYEAMYEKQTISMYWSGRTQHILKELDFAYQQNDMERVKEVLQMKDEHNARITEPYLQTYKISSQEIGASRKGRMRARAQREAGYMGSKKERAMNIKVDEVYNIER